MNLSDLHDAVLFGQAQVKGGPPSIGVVRSIRVSLPRSPDESYASNAQFVYRNYRLWPFVCLASAGVPGLCITDPMDARSVGAFVVLDTVTMEDVNRAQRAWDTNCYFWRDIEPECAAVRIDQELTRTYSDDAVPSLAQSPAVRGRRQTELLVETGLDPVEAWRRQREEDAARARTRQAQETRGAGAGGSGDGFAMPAGVIPVWIYTVGGAVAAVGVFYAWIRIAKSRRNR